MSHLPILILLTLCLGTLLADTCGGNCPSNDCSSCPCGTAVSQQDISSWCSQYGWDQRCCTCIVTNESDGDANAANQNTNGSFDAGLFQINDVNWGQCNGGSAPCDVQSNLNCAIQIYQWAGNSFRLWATAAGCGCA